MTPKGKKSGGDFVLESRHLVGLFLLLVVIFGVVFTLGYLLGRSQFDTKLRAASIKTVDDVDPPAAVPVAKSKAKQESDGPAPPPAGSDWDFYHSADAKTTEDHLQPPPVKNISAKQPVAAPKPAAPKTAKQEKTPAPLDAPLIPKGKIMLQVAAVTSEGDALALAQALQQKKFSAFVIPPSKAPGSDKFYRIQVGPYADNQTASAARQDLEAKGFKSIIKR
jgi:cell division septation protein DedD